MKVFLQSYIWFIDLLKTSNLDFYEVLIKITSLIKALQNLNQMKCYFHIIFQSYDLTDLIILDFT